jgi:hypothetical protein
LAEPAARSPLMAARGRDGGTDRSRARARVEQNRREPNRAGAQAVARGVQAAGNYAYGASESLAATFINPYINAAGRAFGRNPNLRQAGPLEAAINVASVLPVGGIAARATGRVAAAVTNRLRANTTIVAHGGPRNLVGGKIDPSYVRGQVGGGAITNNTAQLNANITQGVRSNLERYGAELKKPFPQYPSQTQAAFTEAQARNAQVVQRSKDWLKAEKRAGGFFSAAPPGDVWAAGGYGLRDVGTGRSTGQGAIHLARVKLGQVSSQPDALAVAAKVKPLASVPLRPTGPGVDVNAVKQAERLIAEFSRPATNRVSGRSGAVVGGVIGSWQNQQRGRR